jgi:hypothetical protein
MMRNISAKIMNGAMPSQSMTLSRLIRGVVLATGVETLLIYDGLIGR